MRVRKPLRAAAAALLLAAGTAVALIPFDAGAEQAAAAPKRTAEPWTVTLVTGDRVTVTPQANGRQAVRIGRAPGRAGIPFSTVTTKAGLTVLPADASAAIAAGRLDPRLFDVSLLRRLGYDDRRTTELPLMVSGGAAPALRGARAVRTIKAAGTTSLRAAKRDTPAFWKTWQAGGKGKLWLVGKMRPALDVSVPQIGAPQAWAAGHTGAGVTVAVLDTGVDAEHPDLAGVISETRDFLGEGMQDDVNHGTHVASIIAGTGAASGGRYRGVAGGAKLRIGKICDWGGCPEDVILAGMEWAAHSGAKVVNMSIGGPAAESADLIVEAIDRLTEETGVLFVVAAGNSREPETIESPGVADDALTVGGVDKVTDALSDFSSEGPRVLPSRRADYAVKPDITAPGNEITAANAGGRDGDAYVSFSGTSMATPHAAGAAAIVAGQHPDWTAARLKEALMSSAEVVPGQTVYQQGAGRVEVARASAATLTATGSVSLGYFPYGRPVVPATKPVRYTNDGPAEVTLRLSLAVQDDAGRAAPEGMFRVGAPTVTVPAGGSADVKLTVDPEAGPTGLYSGTLTATAQDGATVHTAVGAYREAEAYNLSVTTFGPTDQAMTNLLLIDQATGKVTYDRIYERTWLRRLPAGRYTVLTTTFDARANDDGRYTAAAEARELDLRRPSELIFDTRNAVPVSVAVAGVPDAAPLEDIVLQTSYRTDGLSISGTPGQVRLVPGPGRAIDGFSYGVLTSLGQKDVTPTPWTYNVALPGAGRLPADAAFTVRRNTLATVAQKISTQSPDEVRDLTHAGYVPAGLGYSYAPMAPLGGLRTRTDHFTTAPGSDFTSIFLSGSDQLGENSADYESYVPDQVFQAGTRTSRQWNRGVFGPGFVPEEGWDGWRDGDTVHVGVPLLSARDHVTYSHWADAVHTELRSDGAVLAEAEDFAVEAELPPGEQRYRVRSTLRRLEDWTRLSTRVDVRWSFRSARTEGKSVLPLQAVRFLPELDGDNTAPAGAFTFPARVERAVGAPDAGVRSFGVEVSTDDGVTWSPARVAGSGARRTVTVDNPAGGTVSLRASVTDSRGDTVEQTIIAAYAVRAE